jgi:hypothetical protein
MVPSGELPPAPQSPALAAVATARPDPVAPETTRQRFARYCQDHPDAPECRLHEL